MDDFAGGTGADAADGSTPGREGLHLFADGCYDPISGEGGWAFVVYRDTVEIGSGCGGEKDASNNAMEAMALLRASIWIEAHAAGAAAVIWTDSLYATNGCNSLRLIWRRNGWKKADPNPKTRRRAIANADLWKAIDRQLSENPSTTIAWCKGHAGIPGNERADELAEQGRLSMPRC